MGWTVYSESKSHEEALAELRRLHDWTSKDGTRYRVLADGITGHGDRLGYYAAVRIENEAGESQGTFCAVCLITLSPFGYKDMTDSMGPNIDNCPRAVLEALEPLPEPEQNPPDCTTCDGTGKLHGPRWSEHVQGADCHSCDGTGKQRDRWAYARRWRRDAWKRHGGEPQGKQIELAI